MTFSHLVTARLLMPEALRRLMRALQKIHITKPPEGSPVGKEEIVCNAQLCSNYGPKAQVLKGLKVWLAGEEEDLGSHCPLCHLTAKEQLFVQPASRSHPRAPVVHRPGLLVRPIGLLVRLLLFVAQARRVPGQPVPVVLAQLE